jgi:septum formation protein
MTERRLVLGSASPRRAELLRQIGVNSFDIRPADIDETPLKSERPLAYCKRVTRAKGEAIARATHEVVLVSDTTVALGRRILGKPENEQQADAFLRQLSGRRHDVITAVTLIDNAAIRSRVVTTKVRMKRLTEDDIQLYLRSDQWRGKAGGYGIQGMASAFIPWISGSYSAVMGLPLAETAILLQAAQIEIGQGT